MRIRREPGGCGCRIHSAPNAASLRRRSTTWQAEKGERRSAKSQAPPLLRQRKSYLTGSPPSRLRSRCRQVVEFPEYNAGPAKFQNKPSASFGCGTRSRLPLEWVRVGGGELFDRARYRANRSGDVHGLAVIVDVHNDRATRFRNLDMFAGFFHVNEHDIF